MAAYNMPPDTSAKEKIIGGILDIRQLGFILVGLAIGLLLGQMLKPFFGQPGIIIGLIPGLIFGGAFSFIKIKGLNLLQYIRLKKSHKKKTKLLPNIRLEGLEKEDVYKIRNYK